VIGDAIFAAALCIPLAIAAIATFVAPHRIRWIVAAGAAFAALILGAWYAMFYDDGGDEWDTRTTVAFALIVAAVMLFLWLIGIAVGWGTARAVRNNRRRAAAKSR
jgi:hypothetical protein